MAGNARPTISWKWLLLVTMVSLLIITSGLVLKGLRRAAQTIDDCLSYDLDSDGDVDVVDIMQVASHWRCDRWTPTPVATSTATPPLPVTSTPTQKNGLQGVVINGGERMRDLEKLGAWGYSYGLGNYSSENFEYVPLIWPWRGEAPLQGYFSGFSGYALVFNEPGIHETMGLSPSEGAVEFHRIEEIIYPVANDVQFIVGNTTCASWLNGCPDFSWTEGFITEYEARYGTLEVAGWGIHHYPACDGGTASENVYIQRTKNLVSAWENWVASRGKDEELWLSEFGVLEDGRGQEYIQNIIPWLVCHTNRFAWFASYTHIPPWNEGDAGSLLGLTPLGEVYAGFR